MKTNEIPPTNGRSSAFEQPSTRTQAVMEDTAPDTRGRHGPQTEKEQRRTEEEDVRRINPDVNSMDSRG